MKGLILIVILALGGGLVGCGRSEKLAALSPGGRYHAKAWSALAAAPANDFSAVEIKGPDDWFFHEVFSCSDGVVKAISWQSPNDLTVKADCDNESLDLEVVRFEDVIIKYELGKESHG